MSAWYYYRGKLEPVYGEQFGPIASIAKGKVRIRYHEDCDTLAVQARSRQLCKSAIAKYLDSNLVSPERLTVQWPGHYEECFVQEW